MYLEVLKKKWHPVGWNDSFLWVLVPKNYKFFKPYVKDSIFGSSEDSAG